MSSTTIGSYEEYLMHNIEVEWRIALADDEWQYYLEQAKSLGLSETVEHFIDLVYGRAGFDSVRNDGWIVRIRGKTEFRLELKERLEDGRWRETGTSITSPKPLSYILGVLGLTPHLLLDRNCHTLRDDTYEISFDDINTVGKFVEVEYGTSKEPSRMDELVQELAQRRKLPPYGDIIRERMKEDTTFRVLYEQAVKDYRFQEP